MRLVTYEAQKPMNRCNRQLPSHVDQAIVVIKMIDEKPNFRQFITYNLVFGPSQNQLNLLICIDILLV